jgi:hypothetical protein
MEDVNLGKMADDLFKLKFKSDFDDNDFDRSWREEQIEKILEIFETKYSEKIGQANSKDSKIFNLFSTYKKKFGRRKYRK